MHGGKGKKIVGVKISHGKKNGFRFNLKEDSSRCELKLIAGYYFSSRVNGALWILLRIVFNLFWDPSWLKKEEKKSNTKGKKRIKEITFSFKRFLLLYLFVDQFKLLQSCRLLFENPVNLFGFERSLSAKRLCKTNKNDLNKEGERNEWEDKSWFRRYLKMGWRHFLVILIFVIQSQGGNGNDSFEFLSSYINFGICSCQR